MIKTISVIGLAASLLCVRLRGQRQFVLVRHRGLGLRPSRPDAIPDALTAFVETIAMKARSAPSLARLGHAATMPVPLASE
jgi:hypothetical protein